MSRWLAVFGATAAIDGAWTLYVRAVSADHALGAAAASAAIVLLGAYVTVAYMANRRLIAAAAAGAFIGTMASMAF